MMRGRQAVAVAVRAPDGQIACQVEPLNAIYRGWVSRAPFVRGLLGLWDALGLGYRALLYSSNVAAGEAANLNGPVGWGAVALSLAFSLSLFFLAPAGLAQLSETGLGWPHWAGSLVEGGLRLLLIVGYLWGIGQVPEIRRVFGYHGAEHKTINAFEAGAALTPANVARFSLEHPRCGTAFLLTVVVLSILLFSALGPLEWWVRLLSRILLIPVLAGVAYEYLRFTATHFANPLIRWLVWPNLALQRLTTREPDEKMLEVAIAAFEAMRAREDMRARENSVG